MLEDHAGLLALYTLGWRLTHEDRHAAVLVKTLAYLEGTLWDEDHGYFRGSQDADEDYYQLDFGHRVGAGAAR